MTYAIAPWTAADRAAVIELIVAIQQGEFGLSITADDQPDLSDVRGHYRDGGGEFWVGRGPDGDVVGTIALINIGDGVGVLRKMFVHVDHRGGTGLAGQLMQTATSWAVEHGFHQIVLGTTDRMLGAHRFYRKHGFQQIAEDTLPARFPRMAVDSVFFSRDLTANADVWSIDPR